MKVLKNKKLPYIPEIKQKIDDTSDLPYIPASPLGQKSCAYYVCGNVGSGKTSTVVSLLTSHPTKKNPTIPKFLYRFYDHVYIISPSMKTLPLSKLRISDDRLFSKYSDSVLEEIIETEQDSENLNNMIWMDDCIRDLTKSKILCKTILNRRHCTQNDELENQSGLTIFISSQKYNGLPLIHRTNMSHFILFATKNQKELNAIREELMGDLNADQQKKVLKLAWSEPYSFLFIDGTKPRDDRYYKNFDKIVFDEETDSDDDFFD